MKFTTPIIVGRNIAVNLSAPASKDLRSIVQDRVNTGKLIKRGDANCEEDQLAVAPAKSRSLPTARSSRSDFSTAPSSSFAAPSSPTSLINIFRASSIRFFPTSHRGLSGLTKSATRKRNAGTASTQTSIATLLRRGYNSQLCC